MKRQVRELQATAHHEAGHAVAAWRLGLGFRKVTIMLGKNSLGHMLHARSPKWFNPELDSSDRTRLRIERHIIISLAGQIAEGRFRGRPPRSGMESDNRNAVDMATHFCGPRKTTEAYLHYCFLSSSDLVTSNWRRIEAVVAELLKLGTLNYEQTLELVFPGANALRRSMEKYSSDDGRFVLRQPVRPYDDHDRPTDPLTPFRKEQARLFQSAGEGPPT